MGWLWTSTSSENTSSNPSTSPPSNNDASKPPTFAEVSLPPLSDADAPTSSTPIVSPSPAGETPSRPKTRDEIANSELLAFLQGAQKKYGPEDDDEDDDDDDDDLDNDLDDDELTPSQPDAPKPQLTPAHLYPSSASCRALFDQAFYCQSPGGQIINIYRYGVTRRCNQQWSNLWWCMRTNRYLGLEQGEREERVRRRYWEQDMRIRKQAVGSSEDIWRQRTHRVVEGVFVDGKVPDPPEQAEDKTKTY